MNIYLEWADQWSTIKASVENSEQFPEVSMSCHLIYQGVRRPFKEVAPERAAKGTSRCKTEAADPEAMTELSLP